MRRHWCTTAAHLHKLTCPVAQDAGNSAGTRRAQCHGQCQLDIGRVGQAGGLIWLLHQTRSHHHGWLTPYPSSLLFGFHAAPALDRRHVHASVWSGAGSLRPGQPIFCTHVDGAHGPPTWLPSDPVGIDAPSCLALMASRTSISLKAEEEIVPSTF